MKVLCLVTHSQDCENKHRSLSAAGHDVAVERYDDRPHERHGEIVSLAGALAPDAIVYVGAIEGPHDRPVLRSDILRQLRQRAPTVLLCGDGCDKPWWPLLEEYHREACFDVMVSMDGVEETPIAGFPEGMVALTPCDPGAFRPRLWQDRDVPFGTTGGPGHGERAQMLNALCQRGGLNWFRGGAYGEACDFLSRCRCVFNHPMNGTGDRYHVKGRVVEAGWAGACLFERHGSPAVRWFEAGRDYVEYDGVDDLLDRMNRMDHHAVWLTAQRLHEKVQRHHPSVFWGEVFARC